MNKYLVRNFKWIENLGKVPAKVYRLGKRQGTTQNCRQNKRYKLKKPLTDKN